MSNYLISLVSEQTMPNVLFIKEKPLADKYYFISTERMEKLHKTEHIIKSCGLKRSHETIIVPHDDLEKIESGFRRIKLEENDHVILNITGGTKIMMLAAFQYFSKRNAEIHYLTLGNNLVNKIFPYPLKKGQINYRVNLYEYFEANGIYSESSNSLHRPEDDTTDFLLKHFKKYRHLIKYLQQLRNENSIKKALKKGLLSFSSPKVLNWFANNADETVKKETERFLAEAGFDTKNISKKDLDYLTGGWFEEYVYSLIRKMLNLQENEIALNTIIKKNTVENELDVVFIKENALHVIECKTGLKTPYGNIIAETIYKQSALRNNFGLDVQSYLFTMEEIKDVRHRKRAEEMKIRLVDGITIYNLEEIKMIFH